MPVSRDRWPRWFRIVMLAKVPITPINRRKWGPMRLPLIAVFIVAGTQFALADELQEPGDFMRIMEKSKLHYRLDKAPVAHPVESFVCGRRDSSMQRYATANGFVMQSSPQTSEAKEHFTRAESLFQQKRFDEATKEYQATVNAEPGCAVAWLYLGELPFGKHDWKAALANYNKAIEIDDSNAQAHRFAADTLSRMGRYPEAEEEYIHAIARDPAYQEAWKALENLGKQLGFRVEQHPFVVPKGLLGHDRNGDVEIAYPEEGGKIQARWMAYATCKAVWEFEPGFREKRSGSKDNSTSHLTLGEERECVANYIEGELNSMAAERSDKKLPEMKLDELAGHASADVGFLYQVMSAEMLDGFVLFEDIGRACPFSLSMIDKSLLEAVEAYIRKYIVIHVGPKGEGRVG